ncbi:MAG: type I restriction-modification system subunit M [Desulfovibrio sp.]|jgi:type I restriction enzyme M protein|nr:type I restriction-modification system subunit M [Desulfovibrio sp.]
MDIQIYNQIVSFIWGIADDCLRDVYVRGKYRDVILPMTVIRRLDAVLEDTKPDVLNMKKRLDAAGMTNQADALCKTAGQSFCNWSPFRLKDLTSRAKLQQLKTDFIAYLDGFSPNVQEILEKFKFRNQIDTMRDADILGAVIEKFVSPAINLSPHPVLDDQGGVKLSALDNHTMGTIFEELIRRFNEENNEEAGEHFTPRDVVELMADLIFLPVADQIKDSTYSVYDGASGTGGMLTVSQSRLLALAEKQRKTVSIHLFGQEINPETYAITKADMLLKGEGHEADNIAYGSTLTSDAFPSRQFDFMLSNPPYGKSWKNEAEKLGGKKGISDTRFVTSFADNPEFAMIPRVSDGQLLFLLNNASKMKESTKLGSRIAEVHNGSSLFTGDAGQGESNARRYLIERDLVEAIVALPENMFYNTGIGTFIWLLSNRKRYERKGKIQLIDATSLKSPLRKNLGAKNCELSPEIREHILQLYFDFAETKHSKIFNNRAFGYWKVTVLRPLRLNFQASPDRIARVSNGPEFMALAKESQKKVKPTPKGNAEGQKLQRAILDVLHALDAATLHKNAADFANLLAEALDKAKVRVKVKLWREIVFALSEKDATADVCADAEDNQIPDNDLTDSEQIPLDYPGGIAAFMEKEVLPYAPDAWVDESKTQIGYEISFTKHFYKPVPLRELADIVADIRALEAETKGLLDEVLGEAR